MTNEELIRHIEIKIDSLLKEQPAHFLVNVHIKPTNNIKVFIDGDKGVGIDDLVKYNRALHKVLEEESLFPEGDYSLEVSSPGLDEPLKLMRQYVKNIGRDVEVITLDEKKTEGKLLQADENKILVEEIKGKGKKAETILHEIVLSNIKTIKVQIKF